MPFGHKSINISPGLLLIAVHSSVDTAATNGAIIVPGLLKVTLRNHAIIFLRGKDLCDLFRENCSQQSIHYSGPCIKSFLDNDAFSDSL